MLRSYTCVIAVKSCLRRRVAALTRSTTVKERAGAQVRRQMVSVTAEKTPGFRVRAARPTPASAS